MVVQPTGRRERKKLATRNALRAAALELSIEHGVDHVTVEQISDAADVSLRTFFNYFSSKEQAIVSGDSIAVEALLDALADRPDSEPLMDSVRHAVLVLAADIPGRERLERLRLVRRTPSLLPHQLAAYEAMERSIAEVIARRTGRDTAHDMYPALVSASVVAALRVAVQHWMMLDATAGPEALAALIDAALDQLSHGLSTPRSALVH